MQSGQIHQLLYAIAYALMLGRSGLRRRMLLAVLRRSYALHLVEHAYEAGRMRITQPLPYLGYVHVGTNQKLPRHAQLSTQILIQYLGASFLHI